MDKSRQRQYPTVNSSLNIIRELIILLFSIVFWVYCLTAVIVISGSLLHINTDTVLLIRSVLNIEIEGMYSIFMVMGVSVIFSFIFLTVNLISQKRDEQY